MVNEVIVKPLGDCKNLINEAAEVLNSQWKRSLRARVMSLEKSLNATTLPCSLIMITNSENCPKVIGHVRLCSVVGISDSCLIESLVIHLSYRNKGFGKLLMQKAEDYAKYLCYKSIYLTTIDKNEFYTKLGYSFCQPIASFGIHSNILKDLNFLHLNHDFTTKLDNNFLNKNSNIQKYNKPTYWMCKKV
ncbi:unnamed protein product [Gordionus sp. m RMFG-2023]